MNELQRLRSGHSDETQSATLVRLSASTEAPPDSLGKIIEVATVIASARADRWPDDEWWRKQLPSWFVQSFDHPLDVIMANPDLWDFGSWVDAIENRGWEWWSSKTTSERLAVFVTALDLPYSIGPLEYLVRTAGGRNVVVTELWTSG